ncbi:MAG: ABC transporter substrate-binding protein [Actinomycetota bacterium]|nr:ABC transporter substrate-binding protein [Actinomycetota bacterium]
MRLVQWLSATGLAVTLVACSGGGGVDVGGTAGDDDGSGGTDPLLAAIGGEPDQLDPAKTSSYYSFQVLENVYDTLVEPDENLQMQPALAKSWEVSDDQRTWTFTLRDDVEFHDGSAFTADDVVYSYNRIIDEELPVAYRFAAVTKVTAPDDSTVVIELAQPTPNLLASIGGYKGVAIVQEDNVESGDIKNQPVGTGPFALVDYAQGDSITLESNPGYWGGAPAISGVEFSFVSDPTVALQNLESGEVHWTDNLPPQQVSSLVERDDLAVDSAPSNDYWYFAPNQEQEPFDDPRVRQALAWAIDRDEITQAAKFGNATSNQTAIPESSAWYHDYAPYSQDQDRATELLAAAGAEDLSFELMVTSEYPETVSVAQVMSSQLAEVGVDVKIRTLDFATWLDEQGKGNFDVFMLGWLGNIDPDEYYYAQHHSGGSFNFHGYDNPEVDQLLDDARVETDQADRKALYDQIAELIVDDASYVYLYNPDVVQGWSPDVQGYTVRSDRAIRFRDVQLDG